MSEPSATGGRDVHTVRLPLTPPPDDVDVLVVGAGPVGLSAAVELSGRGVRVAVVDRADTFSLVRAGAMGHTPRVVEHFRRWGLLQRIRDEWTVPPEWNRGIRLVTSLVGHELVPVPAPRFAPLDEPAATARRFSAQEALRRPQTALQRVFLDHLGERGVSVSGGWELVALEQDASGVTASLSPTGGGPRRLIRATYLLGADGARSTVRTLAGIQRDGARAADKRLRLVVRTSPRPAELGPAPSATNIVVNAEASGFLAAVSDREWRVYAGPYPLDHEPSEADLIDVARAAFGVPGLDLEIVSATTFYDTTRIASTFRSGRVLLAGDAAHVRTPGGNLGEGFGDVANLGWKLEAVLAGRAPDALLDSYDQERRPHNQRVADHALARSRRTRAVLEQIRLGGVPDDADTGYSATMRRAQIGALLAAEPAGSAGVTFDERYDTSSVIWYEPGQRTHERSWRADVYEEDARPGHRAPDGYVDAYGGTLYDRIGSHFALLVLVDDSQVDEAFVAAARSRRLPLSVVRLTDPHARQVYGAANVLVRPDHHVAWRGAVLPDGGAATVLDRVLAGSPQPTASPVEPPAPSRAEPELVGAQR